MTYPQQQYMPQVQHIDPRYAQQAYAPPAPAPQQPQYGAPQGTPWMPQQYGGAPAGTPPQLGGQGVPTSPPALGQSQRTGEGGPKAPAPRHLVGRTVIFEPIRIDETTTAKDQAGNDVPRPTAYYHLTVVDGGPLQYGDNRDHDISKQHGNTFEINTPCRFTNVSSDRFGIVNEVRDAMARGDMATVGVIVQGTKGNRPFLVTKVGRDLDGNERPDGAQRFELATQVWNTIFNKTFQNPEPRSLVAAPAVAAPQVQYQPTAPAGYPVPPSAQPGYGQNPYGQPAAYPVPGSQTPGYQPGQPTYAQLVAEQSAPGFQTPYAAAHPGTGPYGDGYHPAPQPSPLAQLAQQPVAPPANPAFEAWLATLPPEQQAAQRAAMAQMTPQGPGI